MTAEAFIAAARTWLGVRFVHQGRSRVGVDCAGFLIALAHECGLIDSAGIGPRRYGRLPFEDLGALIANWCSPWEVRPGAILVLRWKATQAPTHFALCTGPSVIHATQLAGRVVEHAYDERWQRMTVSAWRAPGLTE